MNILVCGGAGYIGSHMVNLLGGKGCNVVTFDNLSSGHADAVLSGALVQGCLSDTPALRNLFHQYQFDAVMHFASCIQVGESVHKPAIYYQNNVANTLNLLQVMVEFEVKNFIFSSTAATFGEPLYTPIDEKHPQLPINPYGRSKWLIEQVLPDYDHAYGMKSVCLRYFNAAGANPDGLLGERHEPETHLIPLVLQAASGRRKNITVFGADYDTPDGTCIRDYIHVEDLCEAHWLALQYLRNGGTSQNFNLGNGQGFSVSQVIDTAKAVTGKPIEVTYADRRAGDPARLVADSTAANAILGWKPYLTELSVIVQHAWTWELNTTRFD
ncbi:MAG: UDP-glucose 4-epimerase GalE [Limnobacter sp.]|uniref:UDP-glucose 4-epimerase GalE n=1 Tax=Limnobacter sp. TaxID=2003368 RepID=UPI0022BA7A78|nr:UDP-glucose 4-epimerase GalE [Limnobacter sp.]MCZ8016516.1 UDP-glucose 4-epimerase GalE [Limnobacter sp.]